MAIPAAPAAEVNVHTNQYMEQDPLPGGSRRRFKEEDDDEQEKNNSKRLQREMEEFGYSDSDSYCSSSDSDVDHGDVDGDADVEVNHHVKEDNPLPGGSRKRTRDGAKEDGSVSGSG